MSILEQLYVFYVIWFNYTYMHAVSMLILKSSLAKDSLRYSHQIIV